MYSSSVKMVVLAAMTLLLVGLVAAQTAPVCGKPMASPGPSNCDYRKVDLSGYTCWLYYWYGQANPANAVIDPTCSRYNQYLLNAAIFYNTGSHPVLTNTPMPVNADFSNFYGTISQYNLNVTNCGTTQVLPPGHKRLESRTSTPPAPSGVTYNIDYRTSGCVTAVGDQSNSSACWAFATGAQMEYLKCQLSNKTDTAKLSVRMMTDCTYPFGNGYGFGAVGNPENAFLFFLHSNEFWVSSVPMKPCYESDYPINYAGYGCHGPSLPQSRLTINGYTAAFLGGNETTLAGISDKDGVVAVGYRFDSLFQNYHGGIFVSTTSANMSINHAMALVGVFQNSTTAYYILKNSFGVNWGMAGYANTIRNYNNNGGIATWAWWSSATWT